MLKPAGKKHDLHIKAHREVVTMLTDLCRTLHMNQTQVISALIRQEWTAQHRLRPVKQRPA